MTEENTDARTWAMFCHLSPLLGLVFSVGLAGFVGPLVIWLVKRHEHPFVEDQGKEALNFQLTLLLLLVACVVLTFVSCGWLAPLLLVPVVLQIVFSILASIAANRGESYRYPLNIRIVS